MASSPIQSILKIEDLTSEDEASKVTKNVLYEECLVDDEDDDEPMLTMPNTNTVDTPSTSCSYKQQDFQNKTAPEETKSSDNRMSFKIVQITEHNQTYLTVVPSGWERFGNIFWPNTTNLFIMQKLIQNPSSIPERYWLSQPCILKKSNFRTFEAAKSVIDRIGENSDNRGYFNNTDTTNSPPAQKRQGINQILFKKLLPPEADVTTKTLTTKPYSERDNNPQINLRDTNFSSALENINKNIDQILIKQNKILMELANQNEFNGVVEDRLDQLNKSLSVKESNMNKESTAVQDDSNAFSSLGLLDTPISCREELNELEINLNDSKKIEYLISKMKVICGETGLLDANNCCYNLVDHFFTRSFLLDVSWSGGSRTESRKVALKNYRNVLSVFTNLVILASKDFDEIKSEDFFHEVLNNSKKRYESKIDNNHRDPEEHQTLFSNNFDAASMQDLLNVPISNEEDLDKLELNLKDPNKVEYLITKMKRICGENGTLDSTNCCYNLVDRFFTRSFLVNVSWGGGSRTGSSKLALKKYTNILDVFNSLVTLASKDFSECKSKDFFQNVLKNSKTRYMSEIDHIPRRSAKKVRKQLREDFHTNSVSEDSNTLINGVVDDVKCEFEYLSGYQSYS